MIDNIASAADDAERDRLQAEVATLESQIKEQEALKAAAELEVTRFEEAAKNADELAALAGEIASAKASTDAIIEGLVASQEKIVAGIDARDGQIRDAYKALDGLIFKAENETDSKKQTQAQAVVDVAQAQIDAMHTSTDNDYRLLSQYDKNIRQVSNQLRITMAKLQAEKTNALLLVAIKSNMNITEDITSIDARIGAIDAELAAPTDATDANALGAEKTTLEGTKAELQTQ